MGNTFMRENRRQSQRENQQPESQGKQQIDTSSSNSQSYYITDAKHGRSVCGANHYNGKLFHVPPVDRPNAKWILEPVSTNSGFYNIRDTDHNKYIVASDDGRAYHQDISAGQKNAMWRMVVFTDPYGSTTYFLIDGQFNKALASNYENDTNMYVQEPVGQPNARWALIPN